MTENAFRWAAIAIFGGFAAFGISHRWKVTTSEKLDRWQEGALILFGLRLGSIPMLAGVIAWMIDPGWMDWAKLPLPIWLRCVGLGVLLLWGALLVWTFRNLGRNLTDTVVTRREHTLVATGPYRFVRHPFYVAFALSIVGLSLTAANWFLFAAGCIPLAFVIVRIPIEERKLIERFGDDYRVYKTNTPRFVPRIGKRLAANGGSAPSGRG
jgi:protein-S-isoprenylcysteine O-methyltransferase Ste14